jgi:3-oxoacyl-[acyl-carrier protein] reductase/meso-butanediol dehydrogenase/(S,S)-butanediol dehydrogenase/diacetyl reductase
MAGLEGRVALVTGAARQRGIGRAIALRLAQEGADVVVSGAHRDPQDFPEAEKQSGWQGLASVAAEVEALGRHSLALEADVTRKADVQVLLERTMEAFGRIDILVNNAGAAFCGERPLWEIDDEEWYRVIDVNLNGVYLCCKAVAPVMIEGGRGGRIINLSSAAGRVGIPFYGAYCASKFGVVGLTQMLALEMAPYRVTVNAVAPGITDTDMMDGTFGRMARKMGMEFHQVKEGVCLGVPLGRRATPDEIAGAVAFLASDDACYITGQTLNVNGGSPMG